MKALQQKGKTEVTEGREASTSTGLNKAAVGGRVGGALTSSPVPGFTPKKEPWLVQAFCKSHSRFSTNLE